MSELTSFHQQIMQGDLAAVRASLARDHTLLDQINASGQNALLLAKYYRQPEIAVTCLAWGPNLISSLLVQPG